MLKIKMILGEMTCNTRGALDKKCVYGLIFILGQIIVHNCSCFLGVSITAKTKVSLNSKCTKILNVKRSKRGLFIKPTLVDCLTFASLIVSDTFLDLVPSFSSKFSWRLAGLQSSSCRVGVSLPEPPGV